VNERNYLHSHSEIELYDTCPHLWSELKRTGFKITTPAMDFGKALHRVCQSYGQHCKQIKWTCDTNKIHEFADMAIHEFSLDQDQSDDLHDVAELFASNVKFPDGCMFELQLRYDRDFNLIVDPNTPAWVGGTIDMAYLDQTGNLMIVDWKSDHAIPRENSAFGKRYARQLRRYCAMMLHCARNEAFNCKSETENGLQCSGSDYFVRYDRQSAPVVVRPEQVDQILSEFRDELIRMEEDTEPKTRPGTHCYTCPIARICPAKKDLPTGALIVLDTPELATEAAQQMYLLTGQAAQLDKALRQYASTRGPIRLDGGMLGFWQEIETRYSQTKELIEFLEGKGLTHEMIISNLNPTKTLVKSLVYAICQNNAKKARSVLMEVEETFLGPELKTKFSLKKDEDEE